ncbi:glycosyltransferase [Yeosuana marina]|uniref:glycosyltransferase n=1 Tax=Yeosuana marina TaxID=1565536 RepID=UPI0030EC17CF|tara:strand:- start:1746 stop:2984 length:1239 start_codon:yes stop_codon:yes gene_type:complete
MTKLLLIIGFVWPEPKSSAAGSRMMQLIDVFRSNDYNITFASTCAKKDNAFDLSSLEIQQVSIELNNSSFDEFIKELNPEIVVFDRFMVEEQFGWRVAEQCPDALRILDTEDLHCLRKGREQALKDQSVFNKSYLFNEVSKREIASIYRCDVSLIISEEEIEILKNQFKVSNHLLYYLPFLTEPLSSEAKRKLSKIKEREHFISIGNFLHPPNYDAVLFLKSKIWPLIREKLPKAEIHIYGAYASEKVNQLHNEKEGFLIKGFTDDVNFVMQNAKVCLAPLRFGAGLKGKLIDAMTNGTPCVMTSIATEGMFGGFEPNGFIADEVQEFANKAVELYTDKIFWNGKQKNGFLVMNARFDKQLFVSDFIYKINAIQNNLKVHRLDNFTGQMLQHHTTQSTKFMSKWIEEKNKNN